MHSDPKFPDCEPGKTVRLRGWLSFYEGADIEAEMDRVARQMAEQHNTNLAPVNQ
jgi:hypothetical protein